ncbi:hypothetical protein BH10CYA1_BH10CYA1_61120 [soil metagenome]
MTTREISNDLKRPADLQTFSNIQILDLFKEQRLARMDATANNTNQKPGDFLNIPALDCLTPADHAQSSNDLESIAKQIHNLLHELDSMFNSPGQPPPPRSRHDEISTQPQTSSELPIRSTELSSYSNGGKVIADVDFSKKDGWEFVGNHNAKQMTEAGKSFVRLTIGDGGSHEPGRSEIRMKGSDTFDFGKSYDVKFTNRISIASTPDDGRLKVWQMHNTADNYGTLGPPMTIYTENGHWKMYVTDSKNQESKLKEMRTTYDLGKVEPGQWVNWDIKFDSAKQGGEPGAIKVYKDGELKVSTAGYTSNERDKDGAAITKAPYMQFGNYDWIQDHGGGSPTGNHAVVDYAKMEIVRLNQTV